MTILHRPLQSGDGHAGKGWYKFGHAGEAVRQTDAWEHEAFAEEQARWERSDPEYARICEAVRRARQRGEEASRRADQAKAEWDARVATQRQASDDAQRARYALRADQTALRQTATSRVLALRHQLVDLEERVAGRAVVPPSALGYRQDPRQPRIPTALAGNARAGTRAQLDAGRWIDEEASLGSEATRPLLAGPYPGFTHELSVDPGRMLPCDLARRGVRSTRTRLIELSDGGQRPSPTLRE
jgi:hypothetical protein